MATSNGLSCPLDLPTHLQLFRQQWWIFSVTL
jgi:hypothetical protein